MLYQKESLPDLADSGYIAGPRRQHHLMKTRTPRGALLVGGAREGGRECLESLPILLSDLVIRADRRRFRRLRAGTMSCWHGPPVCDYRGKGTPSHRLGRIHDPSVKGSDRSSFIKPLLLRDRHPRSHNKGVAIHTQPVVR